MRDHVPALKYWECAMRVAGVIATVSISACSAVTAHWHPQDTKGKIGSAAIIFCGEHRSQHGSLRVAVHWH